MLGYFCPSYYNPPNLGIIRPNFQKLKRCIGRHRRVPVCRQTPSYDIIWRYLTSIDVTRTKLTLFDVIKRNTTSFDVILHHLSFIICHLFYAIVIYRNFSTKIVEGCEMKNQNVTNRHKITKNNESSDFNHKSSSTSTHLFIVELNLKNYTYQKVAQ